MTRRHHAFAAAAVATLALMMGCSDEPDADAAQGPRQGPTATPTQSLGPEGEPIYSPAKGEVFALPRDTVEFAILKEGRYEVRIADDLAYQVDVPDGWQVADGVFLHNDEAQAPILVANELGAVTVPKHPCSDHTPRVVGSSVDEIVAAVSELPGVRVSDPERVTLGGRPSTVLDLSTPPGLDVAGCEDASVLFLSSGTVSVDWDEAYQGRLWLTEANDGVVAFVASCTPKACAGAPAVDTMMDSLTFHSDH